MKKILKRLLTAILAMVTVFTTLPVTQIHAADSVYTHSDGHAGMVVKVTDGGSKESTFEEGWLKADGKTAYCIQLGAAFQSGNKIRKNATERLSETQINDVALNLEYVKKHTKNYSAEQAYLLQQCTVWRRLSVHLGWGYKSMLPMMKSPKVSRMNSMPMQKLLPKKTKTVMIAAAISTLARGRT